MVWTFGEVDEEEMMNRIVVFVDSDWAGATDRKSTSGGVVYWSGVAVKTWSRTQRVRALSSGEAEFYATMSGTAEGLGIISLVADLGWDLSLDVMTDSNACKGTCARKGVGKMRHLEVKWLWIQDVVRSGRVKRLLKVSGEWNPADCLTKPYSLSELKRQAGMVGGRIE